MRQNLTVPVAICAAAVTGLIAAGAAGSIEMTWSDSPVSTNWNEVQNWIPPAGETPSVPDTAEEAAYIMDYGGVPTTIDLGVSPTIDYLDLENPQGTLHLGGYTLTLVGPGDSVNAGVIVADSGLSTLRGSFRNTGEVQLVPGSLLILDGPEVRNTGVILVNTGPGVADSAVLLIEGDVLLGDESIPGGEVVLNGTETQPASFEVAFNASLFNRAGHSIVGHGFLQGEITNEGVVEVWPGSILTVASDHFVNRGTVSVTSLSAESLSIEAGSVDVSGSLIPTTLVLDAGATASAGDPILLWAAQASIGGTLTAPGGVELLNGSVMNGTGSVVGDLLNSEGVVGPGSSAGTLEVDGSYVQDVNGRLVIEIGGTSAGEYDVLSVSGTASLAGELEIDALSGLPALSPGQSFTVVRADGGIADGDTFDLLTPEWGTFSDSYDYEAGTVTLTVESWPECVVEDVNRDGTVGVGDFLQILADWGICPPGGPCPSDCSGDLVVNVIDFLQVLAAWGQTCW